MSLASKTYGNALVVDVAGRLDQDHCEAFRYDLAPLLATAAEDGHAIVLDLAELEYISSAGLRCFMLAAKEVKARDGRIVVAALQPMVDEIFKISRFDLLIPVYPSVRAALGAVSADALAAYENR
jgi:anti-anti-sigma factor